MSALPSWQRAHLRPEERVLWSARPSLVGLIPIIAYAVAAFAALVVMRWFGFEEPGAIVRGSAGLALAVLGILVEAARRFVRLRFTTFVVTDERFYSITSFLETNVRSVPLARATRVSLRQGLAGRLLGFWNASIATYGEGARALDIPAIRDGEGLLREMSAGLRRGANVGWLRGD
ncbi:MAG TPA: PH domain-containing protein [Candidatus Thermoplasmatota archaeon]|nr:PH domain-containing protein [Candidatus Thermoplasmatota archaeon]